jgi:nucleoside-diphosphate-sugar epimerase
MTLRVLLFGASGFIGAHVRSVLSADARIGAVVCPGRATVDLIDGDAGTLSDVLRDVAPDAVVSCVGRLGGTGAELIRGNTLTAAKLVEAVAEAATSARLVRLGSAGEYGVVPHGHTVSEDDPAAPVAAYGVSHLAGTRLFELAGLSGRVDAVSLRVFNPIGAGVSEENLLGRAAGRLRSALDAGAGEVTLGPLGPYRDFIDVQDLASLMLAVVTAPEVPHRVINAGSGRAVTAREAVRLLAVEAGYTGLIREQGAAQQRSAAVDWIQAGIDRARDGFGWAPVHELTESIKDIWSAREAA